MNELVAFINYQVLNYFKHDKFQAAVVTLRCIIPKYIDSAKTLEVTLQCLSGSAYPINHFRCC